MKSRLRLYSRRSGSTYSSNSVSRPGRCPLSRGQKSRKWVCAECGLEIMLDTVRRVSENGKELRSEIKGRR